MSTLSFRDALTPSGIASPKSPFDSWRVAAVHTSLLLFAHSLITITLGLLVPSNLLLFAYFPSSLASLHIFVAEFSPLTRNSEPNLRRRRNLQCAVSGFLVPVTIALECVASYRLLSTSSLRSIASIATVIAIWELVTCAAAILLVHASFHALSEVSPVLPVYHNDLPPAYPEESESTPLLFDCACPSEDAPSSLAPDALTVESDSGARPDLDDSSSDESDEDETAANDVMLEKSFARRDARFRPRSSTVIQQSRKLADMVDISPRWRSQSLSGPSQLVVFVSVEVTQSYDE